MQPKTITKKINYSRLDQIILNLLKQPVWLLFYTRKKKKFKLKKINKTKEIKIIEQIKSDKVCSLIQQNIQGASSSTLDITNKMVLQNFDLSLNHGDHLPSYAEGDYAPSTTYYTDLDTNIYTQGKLKSSFLFDFFFFFFNLWVSVNYG